MATNRPPLLAAGLLWVCGACGPVVDGPAPGAVADPAAGEPTRVHLSGVTKIPLLDGDRPVVQVEIPGYGPARFLVDTGAEFSWIAESFATATGMPREPLDATLTDINAQQSIIAERVFIDRLELGEVVVTHARPPLFESIWEGIDGSLGQDWLRVLLVVIDGPGGELILAPRGSKMDTLGRFYESGGAATAYEVQWDDGIPMVSMPVAGLAEPLTFWIDTGVGRMSLTQAAVDELGWTPVGSLKSRGLAGSAHEVPVYDVDSLEIGKLDYTDEAFLLEHASLGWGVLRHKVMVFDNTDDSLWLGDFTRLDR